MSSRVLRRWVVIEQWVLHFHLVGLAILQALQNLVGIYKSVIFVVCIDESKRQNLLDPVGSTVRYEMMKLCAGTV